MWIFSRRPGNWRIWALLCALVLGVAIGLAGGGASLERALREVSWRIQDRPASGNLQIVEIDARSLKAIDVWPWPRRNYAQLIDELRKAGAASIAFDVDFSSRSSRADDEALAAALERAGGQVVLPTFGQRAGSDKQGWIDSLPVAQLRAHAVLAAVNILPDSDGYVRRAPIGTITHGVPRPSLSAMLAGKSGSAGSDFPIDFSIDPASIPRHSFIDIRDGKFDPAQIAGKHILIGATAVELGDRYVVPIHGILPGVVVQAMAIETLSRGAPREGGWLFGLLLAGLLAWCILKIRSRNMLGVAMLAAPLAIFLSALAAQVLASWHFPIVPALATLAFASVAAVAKRMATAARHRRAQDAETGLPNRFALRDSLNRLDSAGLVAARIAEFDKLAAGLGSQGTAELVRRICDRAALVAEGQKIFRIEDRVLCWRCDDREEIERQVTALRALMLSPLEVSGRRVDVALALGYANGATEDCDRIIANAALAADHALVSGSFWHVYAPSEAQAVERELSLLSELDEAIGKREIEVLYQPQLDLRKDRIISVEALVRWHHAERGYLLPDAFVPLAEQNDRIASLTLYVLERTIADLQAWRTAGHPITGAVNLSTKLLISKTFIADLLRLVEVSKVDPSSLIFEITESAAMQHPEAAVAALRSFRDMGIAVSMDDYGTGQSTLSYLKKLPLNELKIDRSFVQYAHQDRGDAVLVRSTVNLAHELGLKVVAEGVEDEDCLSYLRSIGCDLAQGYLISRPVGSGDLLRLLNRQITDAA